MAFVQNSRAKKYARLAYGEEPTEHLESVGDEFIKKLAEKQSSKKLTLEQQFNQEKTFTPGAGHVSLSSFSAGPSSLDEFQKKTKDVETIQELIAKGLTADEAKRYMSKQDILYSSKAEASAQLAQKELLKQCLENKADQDEKVLSVSRREKELGLSMKPNSVETQLLQFAMQCQKQPTTDLRPPDHPINHLAEIEKELFKEHFDPSVLIKTVNRKRRQQLDMLASPAHVSTKPVPKNATLWDVIDKPVVVSKKPESIVETKLYGCRQKKLYTVKDGKIVEVKAGKVSETTRNKSEKEIETCDGQPFVSAGVEEKGFENGVKLTVEEIKAMPRFKNYERGTANKILYVKNIAASVKEEDLVSVFGKFEDSSGPKLIYRLMNGKMRGQAFITFPSTEKATEALNCVNGLVVKGKPLIIQFGRDSNG